MIDAWHSRRAATSGVGSDLSAGVARRQGRRAGTQMVVSAWGIHEFWVLSVIMIYGCAPARVLEFPVIVVANIVPDDGIVGPTTIVYALANDAIDRVVVDLWIVGAIIELKAAPVMVVDDIVI